MNSALGIASIILSLIAVAITTLFLVRQTLFMRHANEMPVSVDLYQEWRTIEFQTARAYVRDSLSNSHEPSIGLAGLPSEVRNPTYKVAAFYSGLGALVNLGLVDERFAVSLLGDSAEADWVVLEPYILRERELSGYDYSFAFYEDLVCRVRINYPLTEAYGLKFRRVSEGYPLLPGSLWRKSMQANRASNTDPQAGSDEQ